MRRSTPGSCASIRLPYRRRRRCRRRTRERIRHRRRQKDDEKIQNEGHGCRGRHHYYCGVFALVVVLLVIVE